MSESILRPGNAGGALLTLVTVQAALATDGWAHGLNAANGGWGTILDNRTAASAFLEVEIVFPGGGYAAGAGSPVIQVHMLRAINPEATPEWPSPPGPNFGTADQLPANAWLGNIALQPTSPNNIRQPMGRLIPLGPWRYAFSLRNASGNSLPVGTVLRGRTSGLIAV